jgi:hypothetical protein
MQHEINDNVKKVNTVIILMFALFLFMLGGCRAEDAGNEPQKGQEQKKAA